jgi:hypothetical protein
MPFMAKKFQPTKLELSVGYHPFPSYPLFEAGIHHPNTKIDSRLKMSRMTSKMNRGLH